MDDAAASGATGEDADALASEADEIRRLVDAGADSPEALRDLAARLREHREREDGIWRAEVKPALVKAGKGRLRGHRQTRGTTDEQRVSHVATYGAMLVGLLFAVVVASSTTGWVLLIPVLALIGFAWKQGREASRGGPDRKL